MGVTVEQVVAAVERWHGLDVEVSPLTGGLTNANYLVIADGERAVVRIPGADSGILAIDRVNEIHNTKAAATTGIGAPVLEALPELGVMVLEYIDGVTMSNATLAATGMPERIASSLRRLHAGPRFLRDFDMFRLTDHYLAVVDERAIEVPVGYRDHLTALPEIERALQAHPVATVPCHNDLLAENYLDDGHLLRIVDYEYSGNNDPAFELGNTCQELGWDDERIEAICAAYYGEATEARLARLKLQMIMSDVGWTLWAAIQARISEIDYDFAGWATERAARAAEKLDSAAFPGWVAAVTKG